MIPVTRKNLETAIAIGVLASIPWTPKMKLFPIQCNRCRHVEPLTNEQLKKFTTSIKSCRCCGHMSYYPMRNRIGRDEEVHMFKPRLTHYFSFI